MAFRRVRFGLAVLAALAVGLGLAALDAGRIRLADHLAGRAADGALGFDYQAAESLGRWAVRLRPADPRFRLGLASTRIARGDAAGASEIIGGLTPGEEASLSPAEALELERVRAEIEVAAGDGRRAARRLQALLNDSIELDPAMESRFLRLLGRTLAWELGQMAEAESAIRGALGTAKDHGLRGEEALARLALAALDRGLRRPLGARVQELLEPSLGLARASGHAPAEAAALLALSRAARERGDLDKQAELLEQALAIYRRIGHRRGPVFIAYDRANRDLARERYVEAHGGYVEARRGFGDLGQLAGVRVCDIGLVRLELRTEQLEAARRRLETLLGELGPTPHRRYALWLRGHIAMHAGEPAAAIESYQDVLALDRRLGTAGAAVSSDVWAMLGQAGLQLGNLAAAEQALAEAQRRAAEQGGVNALAVALLSSADLESLRLGPGDPASGRNPAADAVAFVEAAVELYASDPEAALPTFFLTHFIQASERLRSLLLEGELAPAVKARAHRTLFRLLELTRGRKALAADVSPGARRAIDVGSEDAGSLPELDDLQAALGPRNAVVFYAFGRERAYALMVGKGAEVSVALPTGLRDAEDRTRLLVDLLEREVAGAAPEPGAWRPAAAGLYDALLRPLYAAGLERGMGLTVVPMGPLHQLPWAALHDGAGGDGGFLIEDHVVTTAPSARVLLRRASGADGRVALAVERGVDGPALPEAVAEAGDVASAIGADLVVGPSATELAARRAFPAELVHLAIHGQVEPESPLFSSLSFAPGAAHAAGGQHDGRLTVREILDLDARSELLVLSSCRGSASFTPRGEDWSRPGVGLADAFLAAGSRRVLSSRLAVSDAGARRLMGDFYRELRRYPPAVALNRAQRRGAEGEQGLAWIGFGLSGALPEPTGSTVLSVGGQ